MVRWQGGQSLPLMVAFLLILSACLMYLYNTGQLLLDRVKLTSSADHVAYSIAAQQARLLNLNAYLNRAAIANQLAVAQNISVASWAMFTQPIPSQASVLLVPPMTPVGTVIVQASNGVAMTMKPIAESMGVFIAQNQLANVSIKAQQQILNDAYYLVLLKETPENILEASGLTAEGVKFRYLMTSDNLGLFVDHYTDNKRVRLAPVVMESRESFTAGRRRWDQDFGIRKCDKFHPPGLPHFELIKRGGTQLLGLDEWKGMDTFSLHTYIGNWRSRKWRLPKWVCSHAEAPIGYGSAVSALRGGDTDARDGLAFDGSWSANPVGSSTSGISSPLWDSRRGRHALSPAVPEFFDLRADKLRDGEPELDVVIKLFKEDRDLLTTSGKSAVRVGDKLQQYEELTDDVLSSSSRAVVYFERPIAHYLNGQNRERASLFNPYWRVRMESLRDVDRAATTVLRP